MILKSIFQKFYRDVDIRHLLMKGSIGVSALAAGNRIGKKMTVEERKIGECLQCIQKDLLSATFVVGVLYKW